MQIFAVRQQGVVHVRAKLPWRSDDGDLVDRCQHVQTDALRAAADNRPIPGVADVAERPPVVEEAAHGVRQRCAGAAFSHELAHELRPVRDGDCLVDARRAVGRSADEACCAGADRLYRARTEWDFLNVNIWR